MTLTVQLAGVATTFSLSVNCNESKQRRISLKYEIVLFVLEINFFLLNYACNSLNISTHGHGVEHRHTNFVIGADDVERANGFTDFRVTFLLLVQHAEEYSQITMRVCNDRVGEFSGNIQTIGLNIVHPVNV